MGSGEEKTKHSYYRVVYSVVSSVQGVPLSAKRERHSIGGKKGKMGAAMRNLAAMGVTHGPAGPRRASLREEEPQPTWTSWSEAQPTCHTGPRLTLLPPLRSQPEARQGLWTGPRLWAHWGETVNTAHETNGEHSHSQVGTKAAAHSQRERPRPAWTPSGSCPTWHFNTFCFPTGNTFKPPAATTHLEAKRTFASQETGHLEQRPSVGPWTRRLTPRISLRPRRPLGPSSPGSCGCRVALNLASQCLPPEDRSEMGDRSAEAERAAPNCKIRSVMSLCPVLVIFRWPSRAPRGSAEHPGKESGGLRVASPRAPDRAAPPWSVYALAPCHFVGRMDS